MPFKKNKNTCMIISHNGMPYTVSKGNETQKTCLLKMDSFTETEISQLATLEVGGQLKK